jgi:DNA-binding SARP family transcriptional activator/tetratricopeptide (TPR) repeat protein
MTVQVSAEPLLVPQLRFPSIRETAMPRLRVSDLILRRLAKADIVRVTATAGAGKTTSLVHALTDHEAPVAWLRLDDGDVAAGRFLIHLEHTVLEVSPGTAPVVNDAFQRGISHIDCAALLAQSIEAAPLVLVVDELERVALACDTCEALAAFLRYAPRGLKTIVVSRQEVELGLARAEIDGRVARIGEADLAFSETEAHDALTRLSRDDVDARTAVQATGGWVTGVLFESWRSSEHIHGSGGEADPLSSYLSSEIMATLPDDLQTFLIATAVLDVVTPEAATRFGFDEAASLMRRLRRAHLPVLFESPRAMRCHTRFREYLLERWSELDASRQVDIRLRHGEVLLEEGRWEEALAEFLAGGDTAQAEDTAEPIILGVARRLDLNVVDEWLRAFRPWRVEASPALTAADLLVAVDREQFGRATRAADRLLAMANWDFLADEGLYGAMAWSYFVAGRLPEAYDALSKAPDDVNTRAIRFAIGVELVNDPTHYRDRPSDPHTELDGLLARVDLAHGRFHRTLAYEGGPQRAVRLAQVGALTGLGRLEEAWDRLPIGTSGYTGTRMLMELLAESARPVEAWSELISGRDLLEQSKSPLYRMFALLNEAMLALRFRHDVDQARAVLRAVVKEPTALDRTRVVEQLTLWNGLIALIDGQTGEAVAELRRAVELMTTWDRWLLLPTAAVYLAEAEWRAGNESASDEAADLALETAVKIGSVHTLSRALDEFSSVLSRRLDIEKDPDGPWHDLGRTLIVNADSPTNVVGVPDVRVVELDKPAILVGGVRQEAKLLKTVELLSYLAIEGPVANRARLVAALFESKNDKSANAYLRMAVNTVRQMIGSSDSIVSDGAQVRWNHGRLTTTYAETMAAYRRLRNVTGSERLRLVTRLLDDVSGREILPGARSPWAAEHRLRWSGLVRDLRQTAAEAAYESANYGLAHRLVRAVLVEDPYRERAWRLAMNVASAVGDSDQVIAAYRGCESALSQLSVKPSAATRDLFDRLLL